jgi:hypothetical protein
MGISWSTFRSGAAVAWLWVATAGPAAAQAAAAAPVEAIRGRGLAAGQALFLFAEVHPCAAEAQLPLAQIFTSADGGATWHKHGPALSGSEFLFARAAGGAIWAAGEHTAEGGAVDPFVVTPDGTAHVIAEGPGELVDVAAGSGDELTARVRRTGPHGEKAPGGTQLHVSHDGGRSWSRAGAGDHAAGRKFARVTARSGDWRLADRADGGFDVQKRAGGAWSTVKPFPWTRCPP